MYANLTKLAFAFYSTGGFTPLQNSSMAQKVVAALVAQHGPRAVAAASAALDFAPAWCAALTYASAYFMQYGDCDPNVQAAQFADGVPADLLGMLEFLALYAQG